jgi:hypothetical protein
MVVPGRPVPCMEKVYDNAQGSLFTTVTLAVLNPAAEGEKVIVK